MNIFLQESHIFHIILKIWDKKSNRSKLIKLFLKKIREGLGCNRRDVDHIEVVRANHFHLVASKNFFKVYRRKANSVPTDDKLKGIRKCIGKLSPLISSDQFRTSFSNVSLLNAGLGRKKQLISSVDYFEKKFHVYHQLDFR